MSLPQQVTAQALSLHLAGARPDQIAATLNVSPADVVDALPTDVLDTELRRVDTLWRAVYANAVKGDAGAQMQALRLSQYRDELNARVAPPAAHPTQPAAANIRQAWGDLANAGPELVQSLLNVALHGRSEAARVHAATAALSRIGLTEKVEVAASVRMYAAQLDEGAVADAPQTAGDVIRQRLAMLAERDRQLSTIDAEPE